MTYYDILQVSPNASKEVIEMAFKALAKKHHPDLNPSEMRSQCEENMKMLNHVREVLTDDNLRHQYDLELKNSNYYQQSTVEERHSNDQGFVINPRPWIRYFSRMIDLYIGSFLIVFVWSRLEPTSYFKIFGNLNNYISTALLYVVWLIIEALLLSTWGTTPGKWIFNSKVVSIDGGNLKFTISLKRAFSVFLNGMGLLIPIVSIITMVVSHNKLKNRDYMGFTSWDIQSRSAVIIDKLKPLKVILSVLILFSIFAGLTYYSNTESEAINQKNIAIEELNNIKAELDKEEKAIINWQNELNTRYDEITDLKVQMEEWDADGNFDEYNNHLDEYNDMVDDYNSEYAECENRRLKYNDDIENYNQRYIEVIGE